MDTGTRKLSHIISQLSNKMKSIFFPILTQITVFAYPYITSLYYAGLGKSHHLSMLLFVLCCILPPVLLGTFLVLPTWQEIKRGPRITVGLSFLLLNTLLFILYFRKCLPLPPRSNATLSMILSLILIGYGVGILVSARKES